MNGRAHLLTCIVGIRAQDRVILGGDSAAIGGGICQAMAGRKVFRRGEYAFGYAGSYRLGQILEHDLQIGVVPAGEDPLRALVTCVVPALREALRAGGALKVSDGVETMDKAEILVGFRGRLFVIDDCLQVLEPEGSFLAGGKGEGIALGSLSASEELGEIAERPQDAALRALRAAARFSTSVREPFHIVSTES